MWLLAQALATARVLPGARIRRASSLYDTLENQLIPLYYDRDDHGVPRGWIERMKRTIRTLGWRFNTDRMVIDYANSCYLPAAGAKSSHMR